jgi:hypothetical protein
MYDAAPDDIGHAAARWPSARSRPQRSLLAPCVVQRAVRRLPQVECETSDGVSDGALEAVLLDFAAPSLDGFEL